MPIGVSAHLGRERGAALAREPRVRGRLVRAEDWCLRPFSRPARVGIIQPVQPSITGPSGNRRPVTTRERRDVDRRMLVLGFVTLVMMGWGAGELGPAALHTTDLGAVHDLATQRNQLLTATANALSLCGGVLVIGPLGALCCLALHRAGDRGGSLLLTLSTAGAFLMFNLDKVIVGRPRPPGEHLVSTAQSSFPSGHATLSAAFYCALLIMFLTRRPPRAAAVAGTGAVALLVLGIALSRVYLGVHYPSDVAVGAALGIAWALLVRTSLRERRHSGRNDGWTVRDRHRAPRQLGVDHGIWPRRRTARNRRPSQPGVRLTERHPVS